MLRKSNAATEKLVLDWNPQGLRRQGCPRKINKRTVEEDANESWKTWSEIKEAGL
jgi:hypothetical protein